MTRKRIIIAAVLLVLLCGAWYFGSPRWTLYQMAQAAEARDADRLARYIDFPPLRESVKSQVRGQMAAEIAQPGQGNEGLGAMGAMMAMAMVDPMIDGLLTPEAMRAMFARVPAKGAASQKAPAEENRPFGIEADEARIVHEGLNAFRLRTGKDGEQAADLVFTRHGLGWKLSDIRIPERAGPTN